MKSYQIFLSLIIFFLLSSLTYEQEQEQEESRKIDLLVNEMRLESLSKNDSLIINFYRNFIGDHFIRLISLNDSNIKIESPNPKLADKINKEEKIIEIAINSTEFDESDGYINVTVTKDNTLIEISSVVLQNTTGGIYAYQNKEYSVDQEETVESNNFIIFLDKEQDYKKFDLKFKFNDEEVKNKNATFGFICLPNKNREYIALAKYYTKNDIANLTSITISDIQFEQEITNRYLKDKRETNKPELAFIFSVDMNKKQKFSYSINSEIINVFLIVSIVIALVFAVITFFLIRRKQSAESTNIEGNENLLKDNKEEGEKEEKGENEKEEKEGGEEKEEKEEKIINDENAEEEQKKIEAAEN